MTSETLPATTRKTLVTLLLDRTGSMAAVATQTVAAVNAYIDELKNGGGQIFFTLVQFDAVSGAMQLEKLYEVTPIAEVKPLGSGDFEPRGTTPLYDATGTVIEAIEQALDGRDANVILAVTTDGYSNADRRFSADKVREMITERQGRGWQILFLGTGGIDSYAQGAMMGITPANTVNYGADMASTRAAFASMGANTVMFAAGTRSSMAYTAEQKAAAGDLDYNGSIRRAGVNGRPGPAIGGTIAGSGQHAAVFGIDMSAGWGGAGDTKARHKTEDTTMFTMSAHAMDDQAGR